MILYTVCMKNKIHRHGSPYDRGSADAWYGRKIQPHYYVGASYTTARINEDKMTDKQIDSYLQGYEEQKERKYK